MAYLVLCDERDTSEQHQNWSQFANWKESSKLEFAMPNRASEDSIDFIDYYMAEGELRPIHNIDLVKHNQIIPVVPQSSTSFQHHLYNSYFKKATKLIPKADLYTLRDHR